MSNAIEIAKDNIIQFCKKNKLNFCILQDEFSKEDVIWIRQPDSLDWWEVYSLDLDYIERQLLY